MKGKKPALFLDRDGVINIDYGYVHKKENFHFIEGIFELVTKAKNNNYLVVIVTNQSGIGRSYYSEKDFLDLMDWVCKEFIVNGGVIDAIYYCSDNPSDGKCSYFKGEKFRKPGPGMFLKPMEDFGIDPEISFLIGDQKTDVQAGIAAGIKNIYLFDHTNSSTFDHVIKKMINIK